jgi:hypothetical protein
MVLDDAATTVFISRLEELTPSPSPSPLPERIFESNIQGLGTYMPYKDDPDSLERGLGDGEVYQMNEQIMSGMPFLFICT